MHQGQGQGHRDEHQHICHADAYRHATFECHSLNIVRDTVITVHAKHQSCLRRRCDLE